MLAIDRERVDARLLHRRQQAFGEHMHLLGVDLAGLDELDAAFDWQARACDHGASPFNYFSPVIENMHGDPRHVADMFRMGWQRWPGGTAGSPLPA